MKPPAGAEDWPCRHEDALAFQTTQAETGTLHPVQLPCEGTHAPHPHRHTSTHAASEQRLSACCPDQGSCRRRDPELPQEPTARLTQGSSEGISSVLPRPRQVTAAQAGTSLWRAICMQPALKAFWKGQKFNLSGSKLRTELKQGSVFCISQRTRMGAPSLALQPRSPLACTVPGFQTLLRTCQSAHPSQPATAPALPCTPPLAPGPSQF